jgi:hypothetical protein
MLRKSGTVVQRGPQKVAGMIIMEPYRTRGESENSTIAEKEQWWMDSEDMMLNSQREGEREVKGMKEGREWEGGGTMGRRDSVRIEGVRTGGRKRIL